MPLATHERKPIHALVGLVLYLSSSVAGASILAAYFVVPALLAPEPGLHFGAMGVGAQLALPVFVLLLFLPRLVFRLEGPPWSSLALATAWGAFAASGLSAFSNTLFERAAPALFPNSSNGDTLGYLLSACLGAPLVEELWKGLAVLFAFRLLRPGLDGLSDGVVYATFSALGFATVENIVFYARAALDEVTLNREGAIAAAFMMRGVLSPWGHPLYTSMIGLGVGVARESNRRSTRLLAPVVGYAAAVFLHAVWNASAMSSKDFTHVLLPLCLVLVVGFAALFAGLVHREGRIVREGLRAELALGTISRDELVLVVSPLARLHALLWYGKTGERFIAKAASLAYCHWHSMREGHALVRPLAHGQGSIEILRAEIAGLRRRLPSHFARRGPGRA